MKPRGDATHTKKATEKIKQVCIQEALALTLTTIGQGCLGACENEGKLQPSCTADRVQIVQPL